MDPVTDVLSPHSSSAPIVEPMTPPSPLQQLAFSQQTVENERLFHFRKVFTNDHLKVEFRKFLENVFYSLDSKKFEALIDEILAKHSTYEGMYQELFSRIHEAKPPFIKRIFSQFKALRVIKGVLTKQIQQLINPKAKIDGYMEIGYPGRLMRPLQKAGIELSGKKIVVGYPEKLTDYLEAGFPRPNNSFIPIGNYEPITAVAPESLDLVVCPIGLHHIPESGLKAFVESIAKTLREGGSFIVRDHDVKTDALKSIAHVAHSVFNAATGESLQAELSEERHFKDITTWTEILTCSGFERDPESYVQEADSTENTLIRFTKRPKTADGLERAMRLTTPEYVRAQEQTYLTTLEWHLVHSAKEYADHLQTKPAASFPYFSHIGVLVKGFFDSCRDGIKASSIGAVLRSEYMLMNLFMLVCTSVELFSKGVPFLPLSLVKKEKENTQVESRYAEIHNEYAEFIKTVPFYEFDFMKATRKMVQALSESKKTFSNLYLTSIAVAEFAAKALLSKPLNAMYKDTETGSIYLVIQTPAIQTPSKSIDGVHVVRSTDTHSIIKVGRYLPFRNLIETFSEKGVRIHSIAGQKKIQVKVKIDQDLDLTAIQGATTLSNMAIPTEQGKCYRRLNVEVEKLSDVIKKLKEKGAEITYIHDF